MKNLPLLIVGLLSLALGCTQPPELPEGDVSYAGDLESLVIKRCVSCHSTENPKAELILEQGRGYEALVGRASVQVPNLQLVVPGDPAASYLWHKMDFTAEVGKGMPRTLFGAKRLPEGEIEFFRRWIDDGARP